MNLFSRVLLAVYAFFLAIISVITIIITFKPSIFETISGYISDEVLRNTSARVVMFVIAFIFLMLSLTFLLSGLRSNKDKKAVSKHTNIGEIRISLNSIENIALNASKKLNGVRDTKARVMKQQDAVSIVINVVVMPDINIPSLSEDIQLRVKKSVEESSGIGVNEVKVIIENIHAGTVYKARVE